MGREGNHSQLAGSGASLHSEGDTVLVSNVYIVMTSGCSLLSPHYTHWLNIGAEY